MPDFDPLLPVHDIYRVAYQKLWIDSDRSRFRPEAFRLKRADVEHGSGLSVVVARECPTPEQTDTWTGRTKARAVCKLNVGRIHGLGLELDVVQDGEHHAGIMGLPYADDSSEDAVIQLANDYAEALAEISEICSPKS